MNRVLPISDDYRKLIFEALGLQVVLGLLCDGIGDGGDCRHIAGVALVVFWSGTALMIWKRPRHPSKMDRKLIRFGFLPVLVVAFLWVHMTWIARGID